MEDRKTSVTSLYVVNLHPDISELMLYDKFRPAGPILSARVCRDLVTQRSYGYAYVSFQYAPDAQYAADIMNYDMLYGQPMHILWSVQDPSLYKSGVFVENLVSYTTGDALQEMFSAFGPVLSANVMDEGKGSGFVLLRSQEDAEKAVDKMNGAFVDGRKLSVVHFKSHQTQEVAVSTRAISKFHNLYINNFGEEVYDVDLKELFERFGTTTSVKVMTDEFGKSKGFGFANFKKHKHAQKAMEKLNGKHMNGKVMYVGPAQKKAKRLLELRRIMKERNSKYKDANLFVKNLNPVIDDERLRNEFSPFGTIISAKVMMADGFSKGFGFVCFSSPQEATKAIKEMNGKFLAMKLLYVSLAQCREERQAHLADRYRECFVCGSVAPN